MVEPKAVKIAPKPSRELPPGAVIDARYRVIRTLGTGGTAVVYEVEHARTGARLALKVLSDSSQAGRLEQEAKATAKLRSRHAVRVMDLGMHAGAPYLVMSLLEGQSLRDLLVERSRIDLATAANIVLQVAECLDEAHGLGLVHRDLKPENFHLKKLGANDETSLFDVTVVDFGVVKMAYDDSTTQLTRTGSTVGTPFYMSLEQLRGAAVDPQSDIYSLSVLLYESFTGTVPFQAATLGDLVFAICSAPPIALNVVRPELPQRVSDVVMSGLASQKTDRPKSMREIAEAFRPHADPAFSLWLRDRDNADEGSIDDTREALDKATIKVGSQHRANDLTAKPGTLRAPLTDPPTVHGPTPAGPKIPLAPRPPGPPKPPAKPGEPPRSDPRGVKALDPAMKGTLPIGAATPPVGVAGLRPGAGLSAGLRAPNPQKPQGQALPIDEPSTARDEVDDPPTSVARDRDTPTEMFVKDVHGNVRPPGMESDPPMPSTEVDPAQYLTMNLDIPSVDTSESTAVLSLPMSGAPPTQQSPRPGAQGPSAPTLVSPREMPQGPESNRSSLSGVSAPTFGTPSQSFATAPLGQGQGQGYPYAPYAPPGFQPGNGAAPGGPVSVTTSSSPRSIDVFMNRFGRKGNDIGARAIAKFRAASPAQQALIVGLAAAFGAIILVTLVFLIFF